MYTDKYGGMLLWAAEPPVEVVVISFPRPVDFHSTLIFAPLLTPPFTICLKMFAFCGVDASPSLSAWAWLGISFTVSVWDDSPPSSPAGIL